MPRADGLPELPNTLVIGLGHKARHGKDATAAAMIRQFTSQGYTVAKVGFSDALYSLARSQHGMTTKDAPLLQRVGVEARGRDLLVWIKTAFWRIADLAPQIAIISDVRFTNEAEAVQSYGGRLYRVRRSVNGVPFVDPSRPADHISETELDSFDGWNMTIENNGTTDDLRAKVALLCASLSRVFL